MSGTDPGPTAPPGALARVDFTLQGPGFRLGVQATVPAGPARPAELLPLARALSEAVVSQAAQGLEAQGERIRCGPRCGACCRSLVAVSEVEARQLLAHVEAQGEERRRALLARFAQALQALNDASVLPALQHWAGWSEAEYRRQLTAYFAAGVPCPFLEDESCGIYEERPLTCREFLVTSEPRHCGELGSQHIRRVALPVKMFNAVARWPRRAEGGEGTVQERWVPLVLALAWAAARPDGEQAGAAPSTGPELLRELLEAIED